MDLNPVVITPSGRNVNPKSDTTTASILDAASHIVSEERLGEPRTNQELIDLLARHGWIPARLELPLHRMIGFRNVLVHGYDEVDLAVVEDIVRHRLDDLLAFAAVVRERIAAGR